MTRPTTGSARGGGAGSDRRDEFRPPLKGRRAAALLAVSFPRFPRRPMPLLQGNVDDLRLHVGLQAHQPVLAAEARLLEAAERDVGVRADVVVDPHRAGFDLGGDLLALLLVAGP